jgi:uncharacterized protein (UPF0335 family)
MAIYHCSLKVFSRAEGHSAVAAAAYRAGAMLKDERTSRIHRYEKRHGVKNAFILAPNSAPENLLSRASLWNAAEASENRKNSRVAREVILALPHELSDTERETLSRDMALYLIERYRVAVDVAVHSPVAGDGHDPRNHHAHLLFTTREVTKDGFGAKTRILDDKVSGPQEIEIIREVWETLANDALERAGFPDAKIDRRSLEDQGIDRIPQTHEGKASKNAEALQSLLAKDFKKAYRDDDVDKSDDEEEGSGEKSSSSSSSSGGGSAHNLQSKVRQDDKGRKIDYPAIDKKQTRTTFNDEIKALNEKRAAFGDKPLKEQIKQLDRLMERLDKRVAKLQALEAKTSLKSAIKQSISKVVKLASDLFINRKEVKAVLRLTTEEKQARKERQAIRYGRNYREGLHTEIKEMKHNMALVEAKKDAFRNYKSFVDTIERKLDKHPSITPSKEPDQSKRQITDKEINLKLHLKAEMIRTNVPEKFRAQSPMKGERQSLTTSTAVNKILQTQKEPIRLDKTIEIKPTVKADTKIRTAAARAEFNEKVRAEPSLKAQAEYKQPMRVRIKGIEQAIAEKQAVTSETSKREDRKSWFTPANEKTRPLQRSIEAKLKEQRPPSAVQPKTETQKTFTQAQDRPVKTTTNSQVREKIRAEAETKRVQVPPEYRAEPYETQKEASEQTSETQRTQARSTFNQGATAPNQPEQTTRPRVSDAFNMKSGAHDSDQEQPQRTPSDKPEAEI